MDRCAMGCGFVCTKTETIMSMRQMAWKRVKEPWEWDKVKFEEAEGDVKEIRGFFSPCQGHLCVGNLRDLWGSSWSEVWSLLYPGTYSLSGGVNKLIWMPPVFTKGLSPVLAVPIDFITEFSDIFSALLGAFSAEFGSWRCIPDMLTNVCLHA